MAKRCKQPEYSGLQVASPPTTYSGLQVAIPHNGSIERVRNQEEKEAVLANHRPIPPSLHSAIREDFFRPIDIVSPKRKSKRWKVWVGIGIGLLLIIAAAIAIPLTIIHREQTTPSSSTTTTATTTLPTQAPSPTSTVSLSATNQYKSTSGAYNGTGLARIDPQTGTDETLLMFQHFSGEIRQSYESLSIWTGGNSSDVVVPLSMDGGIRNGTPLAGASYVEGPNTTYHLIYLDANSRVRDVVQHNLSGTWLPGTLSNLNFFASNASSVALDFCFTDSWPGGVIDSVMNNTGGMRTYVGGRDGVVHELAKEYGETTWRDMYTFPSQVDANKGITCFIPNNLQYLFYIDASTLTPAYFWQDHVLSGSNTTLHPRGIWTQGPSSVVTASANSSLTYTVGTYVYYQDVNNAVIGIQPNLTNNQSGSSGTWGSTFKVGSGFAMLNTKMVTRSFSPVGAPPNMKIYFQTTGNTITEFLRSITSGEWSTNTVPVGE